MFKQLEQQYQYNIIEEVPEKSQDISFDSKSNCIKVSNQKEHIQNVTYRQAGKASHENSIRIHLMNSNLAEKNQPIPQIKE